MKRRALRILSFLMMLVMLFSFTAVYPITNAEEIPMQDEALLQGELQAETMIQEPLLPTRIPNELISDEKIQEAGHVRRLPYAEGDMNTVVLANEDGTHSMYLFSYPVKYTDENGNVYDKSNRLTASDRNGYAYVNEENDIQTHLPTDITKNPVMLTYGDYTLATYIVTESLRSVAQLQTESTVLYSGAFGADTALRYKTDFGGYKEDVILYSEAAPTTFTFLLRTSGLVPVAEDGIIRFNDSDTGEIVFTASPFYVYDSAEIPNSYIDTDFTLEELAEGICALTVTLDADYLTTAGLTYPVYVDPTLTYASVGHVETATVYSGEPDTDSTEYDYVGYRDSTHGEARMLVRLNCLKDNMIFRSLSAQQVTSVILNLRAASGGDGDSLMLMYQFSGSSTWTPTAARWSDVAATSFSLPYAGAMISPNSNTSGIYDLNITNIAEGWLGFDDTATEKASQGLIMINNYATSSEYTRRFYGSQSYTGVLPTVTLTYTPTIEDGTYFIRNEETKKLLHIEGDHYMAGTSVEQQDFHAGASVIWNVTLKSNGYYTIQTTVCQDDRSFNTYVGVSDNAYTEGESYDVTLYSSGSKRGSQWAIIPINRENKTTYKLVASPWAEQQKNVDQVLTLPPNPVNGTDVLQNTYVDDDDYRDEWTFHGAMPVSGNEIEYNPTYWNNTQIGYTVLWGKEFPIYIKHISNCYSYAFDCPFNPWENNAPMQPGQSADEVLPMITSPKVIEYVNLDASIEGFTFESIDRFTECPNNTYKVALVIDFLNDYHWYRQNPDGTWSHKRGTTDVTNIDASGDLILDPQTADRYYPATSENDTLDYSQFCGYFAVTPIG